MFFSALTHMILILTSQTYTNTLTQTLYHAVLTNLLFDTPYSTILKNDNCAKINAKKTQRAKTNLHNILAGKI